MVSELNYLSSIANSDHLLISFNFDCGSASKFEGSQKVKYNYHKGDYQSIEPRCEKTGLRGFRPGPTQTGLYNNRR